MKHAKTVVRIAAEFLSGKKSFSSRQIFSWAILLMFTFSTCAIANSRTSPVVASGATVHLTVYPSSAVLHPGSSLQFIWQVTGTRNTKVIWTASQGSITSSGLYVAPKVNAATVDTVSATSASDPRQYATISIQIQPAVTAAVVTGTNASYTLTNPPPPTWFPYYPTSSITDHVLPSDVLQHCYGNSGNCAQGDAMAKFALTNNGAVGPPYGRAGSTVGTIAFPVPSASESELPVYYGYSTDPWYTLSNCLYDSKIHVSFHAPNKAKFSSTAGHDQSIAIYDTVQGLLIQAYTFSSSSTGTLPNSNCTSGPSCAVHVSYNGCSAERVAADSDINSAHYSYTNSYGTYTVGGTSAGNGFSALATVIRQNELMNGTVNHAVALGVYCTNPSVFVFPSSGLLGGCSKNGSNAPPSGALLFTDYTPTQISTMLSRGQISKPQATLLTTLSTYGGYLLITGGPSWTGLSVGNELVEAQDAYNFSGRESPIVPWGCQNHMNDYGEGSCSNGVVSGPFGPSLNVLGGLPLMTGPEGKDTSGRSCTASPGCDVSGHIHVADPCIAKRLAGQPGKC